MGLAQEARNLHATALIAGDRGILIRGPSQSGKTTLALALIGYFSSRKAFCRLVADDQCLARAMHGRLVCTTPPTIAGLAEIPGIGPQPIAFEPAAAIDLVVRLVPTAEVVRFQEEATEEVLGCRVPRLDVGERNVIPALAAIAARLAAPPAA